MINSALEANWSGSKLFGKKGISGFSMTRVNNLSMGQTVWTPQNVVPDQGLHCLSLIQQIFDTLTGSKVDLFKF